MLFGSCCDIIPCHSFRLVIVFFALLEDQSITDNAIHEFKSSTSI
jgi:hypothetical protein